MDGLVSVHQRAELDAPAQLINVMNGDADSTATSNSVIIDEGPGPNCQYGHATNLATSL